MSAIPAITLGLSSAFPDSAKVLGNAQTKMATVIGSAVDIEIAAVLAQISALSGLISGLQSQLNDLNSKVSRLGIISTPTPTPNITPTLTPTPTPTPSIVPVVLASIIISPNTISLLTNSTQQFTAVGTDASGNTISVVPNWSINKSLLGSTINNIGFFTAGSQEGQIIITATIGSISGQAFATISSPSTIIRNPTPTPTPTPTRPALTPTLGGGSSTPRLNF
jgi:hypothetical protein